MAFTSFVSARNLTTRYNIADEMKQNLETPQQQQQSVARKELEDMKENVPEFLPRDVNIIPSVESIFKDFDMSEEMEEDDLILLHPNYLEENECMESSSALCTRASRRPITLKPRSLPPQERPPLTEREIFASPRVSSGLRSSESSPPFPTDSVPRQPRPIRQVVTPSPFGKNGKQRRGNDASKSPFFLPLDVSESKETQSRQLLPSPSSGVDMIRPHPVTTAFDLEIVHERDMPWSSPNSFIPIGENDVDFNAS